LLCINGTKHVGYKHW